MCLRGIHKLDKPKLTLAQKLRRNEVKMIISNLFEKKKPVISFEIFPPKKEAELQNIDATLQTLATLHPDFISVTFGAGGSSADNRTVKLAQKIKKDYGIEPLVHLTCISNSKEEIKEILGQMESAGLKNVLALRGDVNPNVPAKDDFRYASELVSFIKEQGDFHVSGACYPEVHLEAADEVSDLRNLRKKVDAGAEHLVSQLFFDNNKFYDFLSKVRIAGIDAPVEAGIMPVTNKAQIKRMVTMCGAALPEKFERILERYGENKEALFDAGMVYAVNQIVELISSGVDGIHIFTMNNPVVAGRICEEIKNLI
ncbi:5,10-methylenetetrahydrofolate reductase [Lachnospiraceae bacterium]|nr:5,10-methylenetetrahydrofolate reductase [Lachnospiraceae bacterium]